MVELAGSKHGLLATSNATFPGFLTSARLRRDQFGFLWTEAAVRHRMEDMPAGGVLIFESLPSL